MLVKSEKAHLDVCQMCDECSGRAERRRNAVMKCGMLASSVHLANNICSGRLRGRRH